MHRRTDIVRRVALLSVAAIGLGCGKALVLRVPEAPWASTRVAPALFDVSDYSGCDYMTVRVDFLRHGENLSDEDVALARRVANSMKAELRSRNVHVTRGEEHAFWTLNILAASDPRVGGFLFTAHFALRGLQERRGSGVFAYPDEAHDEEHAPSLYSGLAFGTYLELEASARAYVRHALDAVQPTSDQLCGASREAREREELIEQALDPQSASAGGPAKVEFD